MLTKRPFRSPATPDLPAEARASGRVSLRYEDIAQDGRLMLDAVPHALGEVCWNLLMSRHPLSKVAPQSGVLPILSRLVAEGTGGPIPVRNSIEGEGAYRLSKTLGADGAVDRLILELWVDLYGNEGRTFGPIIDGKGERIHVGRCFAEHVFTRPFAPREERKVLSFGEHHPLPEHVYDWRAPDELLALPDGAQVATQSASGCEFLDEMALDDVPVHFSLSHTDSNQHVNSLVYPRLFEEAALRRFGKLGKKTAVLATVVELAYRKPCFAGDRMRFSLRAFEHERGLGAVGTLIADGDASARPSLVARMFFEG